MRTSIRKHYREIAVFVELANLGWKELQFRGKFPLTDQLEPYGEHQKLLRRIDLALERKFATVQPLVDVPPMFFKRWSQCPRRDWRRVHSYHLVRRLFDTIGYLVKAAAHGTTSASSAQMTLQLRFADDGTVFRVQDPYEKFLLALTNCDLQRLKSCATCGRFFVAWRKDQKACSLRCANRLRVTKFRKKQAEYLKNREFRKRTGLPAVRHRRREIIALHHTLTENPTDSEDASGEEAKTR